jgi:hypothetical protein
MATRRGDGGVEESRPWLGTALLAAALVIGLGLLIALLVAHGRPVSDSATAELAHLKMLGTALKLHAEEHGGKFPPAIADIDWRQNLPGMQWAGLPAAVSQFHDPATGALMKWKYYPGHTDADPPQTILAASPVAVGPEKNQRLVARLDGTAESIDEATFQFEIQRQTSAR